MKFRKILAGVVVAGIVGGVGFLAVKTIEWMGREDEEVRVEQKKAKLKAKLIDENLGGIEVDNRTEGMMGVMRMAVKIEEGFYEVGKRVEKMVLPKERAREMYVFIGEEKWYFKVSLMRGAGETVEDAMRMLEEVERRKVKVQEYIDVRLERRGYYK